MALKFLYTLKLSDHDNKEGLLLQINHFYRHLHILPNEQAIATLNDGDKLDALAVIVKLMCGKTRLGKSVYVEKPQFVQIPVKPCGN